MALGVPIMDTMPHGAAPPPRVGVDSWRPTATSIHHRLIALRALAPPCGARPLRCVPRAERRGRLHACARRPATRRWSRWRSRSRRSSACGSCGTTSCRCRATRSSARTRSGARRRRAAWSPRTRSRCLALHGGTMPPRAGIAVLRAATVAGVLELTVPAPDRRLSRRARGRRRWTTLAVALALGACRRERRALRDARRRLPRCRDLRRSTSSSRRRCWRSCEARRSCAAGLMRAETEPRIEVAAHRRERRGDARRSDGTSA